MGPGGLPGLQNRVGVGDPGAGGFDSHAPSLPDFRMAEPRMRAAAGSSPLPLLFPEARLTAILTTVAVVGWDRL